MIRARDNGGTRRRHVGFSMIEVLVALLVLLIGLLGVVRMQLLSVQNNQGAYMRTQATYIAADMMDRLRSNREGRNIGPIDAPVDFYDCFDTNLTSGSCAAPASAPNCDATDGCTAQQLVDIDMREIAAHFRNIYNEDDYRATLPIGRLTVVRTPSGVAATDEYVITVSWNERDWQDTGGTVERADSVQRTVQLRSQIRRSEGLIPGAPDPNDV